MDVVLNTIRSKHKIEIAISTETILYLPFFIAYYNKDFQNNPFCELDVDIIGTTKDKRFIHDDKLKGDGFATFAVLLGLADAAICDPSFFIYLDNCEDDQLRFELERFQSKLEISTKKIILKDKDNPSLNECLQLDPSRKELIFKNVSKFRNKILNTSTKIIGGLVSKIAFSAIGSEDLLDSFVNDKNIGRLYKQDEEGTKFGKNYLTNSFIYYKSPSTGYEIGSIYFNKYLDYELKKKEIDPKHKILLKNQLTSFGDELKLLTKNKIEKDEDGKWKADNNIDFSPNSVAFSCDYISFDYLIDINHSIDSKPRVVELEDLVYDSTMNYMFTGILGNLKLESLDKFKGLLYSIDKNLFHINSYLKRSKTTGLIEYFKTKLKHSKETQDLLLNLLIANTDILSQIKKDIENPKIKFQFENLLDYYVTRLHKWRQISEFGGLYYSKTTPIVEHLRQSVNLRFNNHQPGKKIDYDLYIEKDLLNGFREQEKYYWRLENYISEKKGDKWKIIFAPILVIVFLFRKLNIKRIDNKFPGLESALWYFVRKPLMLYVFGSIFILLEIVSSILHIFHLYIPTDLFNYTYSHTQVFPGNPNITYSIPNVIHFGSLFLWLGIIYIVTTFIAYRYLLGLKAESKFYYRNEKQ